MTAGVRFFNEKNSEYACNKEKRKMLYKKILGLDLIVEKQGEVSYYS